MSDKDLLTIDKIRELEYNIVDYLDVKNYLSLSAKKVLIEKILDICIIEEDIKKVDFALKQFGYEYMLISQYSNVDFDVEDVVQLYDELKEHELIDQILKSVPLSEIQFISYVLEKEIEQIQLVDNSFSNVISKQLSKAVDKLPDQKGLAKLIKDLPKQFNKMDSSKLKYLADAIGWNFGKKDA